MAWMRSALCSAALLLAGMALHAQEVPSGWKVVKDKAGTCQIAVPADWVADKLLSSAVAHGLRPGQGFAEAMSTAKMVVPPEKIIEESAKRLWYLTKSNGPATGTDWYVAVATEPICTAQVNFKVPALEDTARKIALSLTKAK